MDESSKEAGGKKPEKPEIKGQKLASLQERMAAAKAMEDAAKKNVETHGNVSPTKEQEAADRGKVTEAQKAAAEKLAEMVKKKEEESKPKPT